MKTCLRCGFNSTVDNIGEKLVNFVCAPCRNDKEYWSFKEPQEIRDTPPEYIGGFDNEQSTDN